MKVSSAIVHVFRPEEPQALSDARAIVEVTRQYIRRLPSLEGVSYRVTNPDPMLVSDKRAAVTDSGNGYGFAVILEGRDHECFVTGSKERIKGKLVIIVVCMPDATHVSFVGSTRFATPQFGAMNSHLQETISRAHDNALSKASRRARLADWKRRIFG